MKPWEIIASFVIIALTIIIVSFIGVHLYSNEGCGCSYNVAATANRTGNGAITITYNGGPDADELAKQDTFQVQINGKNATNMDAIRQSGLNATLDPATGLDNKINSTLNITGRDITHSDASKKAHVVVAVTFKDGSQAVILDTYT